MNDILKGNFKTQKEVTSKSDVKEKDSLQQKLRQAALNSIGGSMVYVERTELTWNGDEDTNK